MSHACAAISHTGPSPASRSAIMYTSGCGLDLFTSSADRTAVNRSSRSARPNSARVDPSLPFVKAIRRHPAPERIWQAFVAPSAGSSWAKVSITASTSCSLTPLDRNVRTREARRNSANGRYAPASDQAKASRSAWAKQSSRVSWGAPSSTNRVIGRWSVNSVPITSNTAVGAPSRALAGLVGDVGLDAMRPPPT
jgi:hypothetical protein